MKNRLPQSFPHAGNGRKVSQPAAARLVGEPPKLSQRVACKAAETVGQHPVVVLAAAFVAGILIGKWVKRS